MGLCDVPGISWVCDKVGEAAATLVSAPFDWLAAAMGNAAAWVFEQVWAVFDATTLVDVTNPGYRRVYALLFGVACTLMLIFFCFQLVTALVRHEPGALGRALGGLAKASLGSALVLAVTGLLLETTDQICVGIVQATGETMASMGGRIAALAAGLAGITLAAPGAGAILAIFLAGLAISSAFVVWFSLLVRKALLLVALVFGPFALTGNTWDPARGWFGKWASFVIALILSKLVLVVTLLIGVTLAGSPLEPDLQSVSEPVTGVVLMLISAFAPYMTYKAISFMGADMYHLMSAEQEAKQALNRPIPIRPAPANPPTTLNNPNAGGGGSAPPSPAPTLPAPSNGSPSAGGSPSNGTAVGTAGAAGVAGVVGVRAAQAGPAAGQKVGGAATTAADAAQPTPPPATTFTPTSSPLSPQPSPAPAAGD